MIEISPVHLAEIQKAMKENPQKVNIALARSINRAATNARANMSKKVRERYIVKASDIKETVSLTKATQYKPFATVKSSGSRIDLTKFKLTPKILFKGQNNYKVQVLKTGGYKHVPGFAAESNKWGLFMRTGPKRFPIKRLMGPSVPEMVGNKSIIEWIEKEAQSMLNDRIGHELEQLGAKA